MITRLHIAGYKSLFDVDLELPALAVILGPHSSGKSNLFDALDLLSRTVTTRTLRDAFSEHRGHILESFSAGSGESPARASASSGFSRITLETELALSDASVDRVETRIRQMREGMGKTSAAARKKWARDRRLRYRLTIEVSQSSAVMRVADERLVALNGDGSESGRRAPIIERVKDKLRLRMDAQGHPTDFDLGLDYALISQPLYTPYYAHIAAFKEEMAAMRTYRLEPSAMRRGSSNCPGLQLGRDGSNLASWLTALAAGERGALASANRAVADLLAGSDELKLTKGAQGSSEIKLVEHGKVVSLALVSDTVLRLLGLLASTGVPGETTTLAIEEPENGLPARFYRGVARLLGHTAETGTQVLINTHSPHFASLFEDSAILVSERGPTGSQFSTFASSGPLMRAHELGKALA